jgi:putative ABC transport system ATP-binding protein
MSTVKVRNLYKTFGEGTLAVHALAGIDLDVDKAEFVCLSGPSGSGKTTLLNMIGGLDRPTSGEITVAGQRVDQMDKGELAEMRLRRIGFVFQAYNLIPVLTARENVEFVMQLQGIPTTERKQKAMDILKEVQLEGLEDRRPAEMSGGQQQRVAVARALANDPAVVLADEPTGNLDLHTAERLLELIRHLNEVHGTTFIVSTHDKLVMGYARRLIKMHDGKIIDDAVQR